MSEEQSEYKTPGEQKPDEPRGLQCRVCGCQHLEVTHTEKLPNETIRRRRVCRHCGARHVTFESLNGNTGVRRGGK